MPTILSMRVSNKSFSLFINFFDFLLTGVLVAVGFAMKNKDIFRPHDQEDIQKYQKLVEYYIAINSGVLCLITLGIITYSLQKFQKIYMKLRFFLEGPNFLVSIFYAFANIFFLNEKINEMHTGNKLIDFAVDLIIQQKIERLKFNIAFMVILGCFMFIRLFFIIWLNFTKYDRTIGSL